MFERFTERARQVVVLAQDEARALKHNYIGTEHILLGLLREEEGVAARALESLGITVEAAREAVVNAVGLGEGEEATTGQIPFTPRAKAVLELALRESVSVGYGYIGTEHILLGVVRENGGVAARVLLDFDADAEKVRGEVIGMLSDPGSRRKTAEAPDENAWLQDNLRSLVVAVRGVKEAAASAQRLERAEALENVERDLKRISEALRALPDS